MSSSAAQEPKFSYMYKLFDRTMPLRHGILKVDINNPNRKQLFALINDEDAAQQIVSILNEVPDDISELEATGVDDVDDGALSWADFGKQQQAKRENVFDKYGDDTDE